MAPAATVRKIASEKKAPNARTAIALHGPTPPRNTTSRSPHLAAASAGRADASQKRAVPKSTSRRTRTAQRAEMVVGSMDGDALEAEPIGAGCVPVGSSRKAYWPLVTCPSVAEVTR